MGGGRDGEGEGKGGRREGGDVEVTRSPPPLRIQ